MTVMREVRAAPSSDATYCLAIVSRVGSILKLRCWRGAAPTGDRLGTVVNRLQEVYKFHAGAGGNQLTASRAITCEQLRSGCELVCNMLKRTYGIWLWHSLPHLRSANSR